MYLLNKYFHPENFVFSNKKLDNTLQIASKKLPFKLERGDTDVIHLQIKHPKSGWENLACSELTFQVKKTPSVKTKTKKQAGLATDDQTKFEIKSNGAIIWKDKSGTTLLETEEGRPYGMSGEAWLLCFKQNPGMRLYGMGEKATPFEKTGLRHRFWNVDVWADVNGNAMKESKYDPEYITIPYVIIKQDETYIGVLMDNPYPGVISSTKPLSSVAGQMKVDTHESQVIYMGAEKGLASLYFIYGPSLAELTRKLQKLCGYSPLPPMWALGHQQCRWGYRDCKDLTALADKFDEHKIPNDGLWLDIDYMEGYRVFSFNKTNFKDPKAEIAAIQRRGYRVVPILDPGVKREKGNPVYDTGKRKKVFCENPAGTDFIGMVWPGFTVFPDFSLEEARKWWAALVEQFAQSGITSAWLDMNDPATGFIDCNAMRFEHGKRDHEAYHSQYASLMAKASHAGFQKSLGNERVFLLSRSGFTGSQKWAANWTGDNFSSYIHLRGSIAKSMNLAISGMPFNGGDVAGFGGDTWEQLALDWIKAGFLFPFLRNHCVANRRAQEPWALGERVLHIYRHFVCLRYKLMPYLYQCFIAQAESGEAIMRPLFYDFVNEKGSLDYIDTQFMLGSALMHAPVVDEEVKQREVFLPKETWFDLQQGSWINGNSHFIEAAKEDASTPLYVRDGSLLPMREGWPEDNKTNLCQIELWAFLSNNCTREAKLSYHADDGTTFNYQKGERSSLEWSAQREASTLHIRESLHSEGFGKIKCKVVTLEEIKSVTWTDTEGERILKSSPFKQNLAGAKLRLLLWT